MDLGIIYENIEPKNRNTPGPQSQNRDEAQNRKRSRWFVVITVCLGIFCVFLVIALILLYVYLTAERDQLWQNITSMTQKERELETKVKNFSVALKEKFSGSCSYFISSEKKNWTDSRRFCRDRGGDLVIINTEEEQKYVSSIVNENVWIGLSDTEKEGNMKWVDNTPVINGFWIPGEPSDHGSNEDCVVISEFSDTFMNWNDLPCSEKRKWICEK
ncbi:putative C-type lectin domain family 4 member E [Triplophysa rosa]|uniref:C-type lectin domain family 4 member E n=2 Tax=Triplophysa rosa TaxID=992332 RepID=A0A9W7WYZ3_TRIRA|nr:putative C-type lectin domain family 4 member E [Triplophysa rosa]